MQNIGIMASSANIDFMIKGVFSYELFGQTLWITTTHICVLIVMIVLIVFAILAKKCMMKATDVPGGFQNFIEIIVSSLDKVVKGSMGNCAPKFVNYISTIFIFILTCNISGLFGLRPPTADYGVTLPLGIITFIMIHYNKFKYQKVSGFIKDLCDPWVFWAPINLIGYVAVPISLSLRLFANVLSGTVMMALIYGLLGWFATIWPAGLHVYFDLFSGAIQTYVFCMLTMVYVSDAVGNEA